MNRSMDIFFHALLPKDKKFFPLFDESARNMVETARALSVALVADSVSRIQAFEKINQLEKQGDEITHAIIQEATATFLIPFDREDVQALANALDDVVDFVYASSKAIDLYKVHVITPEMKELAELVVHAAVELQQAIFKMRSLRNKREVLAHLKQIKGFENEADAIMNAAIAKLFREEKSAPELLKQMEIVTLLENATDKCEDAANVIESVLIKYS